MEAVSGLDKQKETGIWETLCLPPPLRGISFESKNMLITPTCQELYLASGMPASTPPALIPLGLTSPLLKGHLGTLPQSLCSCSSESMKYGE